jgi:hypothetical protein
MTGRDIQKDQFVSPLFFVSSGNFHRIPGVAQLQEVRPFDDATTMYIQARNDSLCQHESTFFLKRGIKRNQKEKMSSQRQWNFAYYI